MIKNLALKGGGVKGVAYVGAIKELHEAKIFDGLQRIAGTSAGALMACMICAGYNVDEIEKLMLSIEFKKFETGKNYIRIFTKYGLYSGKYILKFIGDFLNNSPKKLHENSTFLDMKNAGCKELYVFSCNTNLHTITEFSADKTPHVKVAEAVRASMSIPFFFKAWQFPDKYPDDHIYVDGGVVFNYPLSFFDDPRFNTMAHVNFESIGLFLYTIPNGKSTVEKFFKPLNFSKQLFESLLITQDYIILEDKEQVQRTILIDDLNIPATDFNITSAQCDALMESGKNATLKFLQNLPIDLKIV